MDGLVYLLNQAGLALAQANEQIAELTKRIAALEAAARKDDDE